MLRNLLNYPISAINSGKNRLLTIRSSWYLGDAMKKFNDNKEYEKALQLFDEHKEKDLLKISKYHLTQALISSVGIRDLNRALAIDQMLPLKLKKDGYIVASLIQVAMICGNIDLAESFFHRAKKKDPAIYGSMMKGYIRNGLPEKAIEIFKQIENPNEINLILLFNACAQVQSSSALEFVKHVASQMSLTCHSNEKLVNSLIDALIKCRDCSSAEEYFLNSKKNVITYGNLMNGYNKERNPQKTLQLFSQMIHDQLEPTTSTYLCLFNALSQLGFSSLSQSYAKKMPERFFSSPRIQTALIHMFGKSACIDEARSVFDQISPPNQFAYTTMINSYGLNGMGVEAIELFQRMPSNMMNEATYVSVLNACSHSGLVQEAQRIFEMSPIKTGQMHAVMVDCLSRAKLFDQALAFIDEYEQNQSPIISMQMSLLSGARNANNQRLSEKMFERMKRTFPHLVDSLTSASVLLANAYASTGELDRALVIRDQLQQSGQRKKVGLVWTELNGEIFQFRAHDRSHAESSEIYAELNELTKELLEHGHQFDQSWVTRTIGKNETVQSILCGHSEKLAIAFHFIRNRKPTRIQITKNLRVCGDCHQTTKLFARIRNCTIIVRDANRIHHFYPNGQCSCQDYF
ncbi:unnamed protein product [Adineta ricciae]|uniref:DYW domain-containing protein n=1 Tax=Adineta ricciae TaxID=249248 RepID=A0A814Q954_ADIRI|nr:unnamed protein product [Adineta ricciae]CAF1116778.1 unnamed protein product [Adineta ricciae]